MRRRSRLNSGNSANTSTQTAMASQIQPSTVSPRPPVTASPKNSTRIGMNSSISRMALRANTAEVVRCAPRRLATRMPSMRLAGVAARGPISNAMK